MNGPVKHGATSDDSFIAVGDSYEYNILLWVYSYKYKYKLISMCNMQMYTRSDEIRLDLHWLNLRVHGCMLLKLLNVRL